MNPFVSSGEDNNEEGGEHSEDKGDYAEEEIPHIGEVTGAIQSKVLSWTLTFASMKRVNI